MIDTCHRRFICNKKQLQILLDVLSLNAVFILANPNLVSETKNQGAMNNIRECSDIAQLKLIPRV